MIVSFCQYSTSISHLLRKKEINRRDPCLLLPSPIHFFRALKTLHPLRITSKGQPSKLTESSNGFWRFLKAIVGQGQLLEEPQVGDLHVHATFTNWSVSTGNKIRAAACICSVIRHKGWDRDSCQGEGGGTKKSGWASYQPSSGSGACTVTVCIAGRSLQMVHDCSVYDLPRMWSVGRIPLSCVSSLKKRKRYLPREAPMQLGCPSN